VFGTPDPERVDGYVSATMPLELSGSIIDGIRIEFEGGRAVKVDAATGADALGRWSLRDEGASRLGEIALVDGEGRIGPLGRVFYDTLIDENAASHIALGGGLRAPRRRPDGAAADQQEQGARRLHDRKPRARRRRDHRVRRARPVLRAGAWQV
jgi:leucyl aminopeptidase (aminopeptidase T)